MEILLTGFTAFLTQEWIETAFPNDHVLTTCAKGEALSDTQIKTVTLESRQLLDQLAETYQFDRVVYFSEYLLPHGDQEGELDRLRRVLQSCREREVELLYLSGPEAAFAPSTGKTLLANAAEELCFHYARTSKLQVKVFRLPYLYAVSASGADQFARLFEQMPAGTVQWMNRLRSRCWRSVQKNWPISLPGCSIHGHRSRSDLRCRMFLGTHRGSWARCCKSCSPG